MSTTTTNIDSSSKFTRGEKCIFAHAVITFCGIIAVVIVYYGHACLVRHRGGLGPGLSRRTLPADSTASSEVRNPEESSYRCVGALYVQENGAEHLACGAVLLRARWSLVPARCVTARAHPDLSHLLPYWTLRYNGNSAGVRRGVSHPLYDSEDGTCDVGLLEHETVLADPTPICTVPTEAIDDAMLSELKDLHIVGYQDRGGWSVTLVLALSSAKCAQFTAPVTERTVGAICVSAPSDGSDDGRDTLLGGALFASSQLVGISSWGVGLYKSFPLVVIDIAHFKDWLDMTMSEGFV